MDAPSRRDPGRRHEHPDDVVARAAGEAAQHLARAALEQDAAAGLVPPWARRGLHPHELAAKVSFAAIADAQALAALGLSQRLNDDRAAFVELLAADLAAQPTGRAVVSRLLALETAGIVQVPGVADLVTATATAARHALLVHADTATAIAASEAAAQGVAFDVGTGLGAVALDQIDQLAQRLAVAPHVDLVRALRDAAIHLPTAPDPGGLVTQLRATAAGLSAKPLDQAARDAVAQADGLGRQVPAEQVTPAQIYASELLDGATCGPCSFVDGQEYSTLAAARIDYPHGTYLFCEGGDRCRGTLVYVWPTEAPAST